MLFAIFCALGAWNFLQVVLTGHGLYTAADRTFFQLIAVICVGFAQWITSRHRAGKKTQEVPPPGGPMRQPQYGDPDYIASIDD